MHLICVLGGSGESCEYWVGGRCERGDIQARTEGAMRICSDYVCRRGSMCRSVEIPKPKESTYYELESKWMLDQVTAGTILHWRYVSYYNGARGPWYSVKAKAVEGGEAHKALLTRKEKTPEFRVVEAAQEDAVRKAGEILEYVKELNYHPAELATDAARELLRQLLRLQKETHYLASRDYGSPRSRNPIL